MHLSIFTNQHPESLHFREVQSANQKKDANFTSVKIPYIRNMVSLQHDVGKFSPINIARDTKKEPNQIYWYPIVHRVLGPRNLIEKITGSGKYPALTKNKLIGFQIEIYSTDFLGALVDCWHVFYSSIAIPRDTDCLRKQLGALAPSRLQVGFFFCTRCLHDQPYRESIFK